jgi:hypothetical protein
VSADAVVQSTTAGIPQQRSRGALVERHPARQIRRRALCRLGWHTSVFTWGPGRGVWCNHCHTRVTDA